MSRIIISDRVVQDLKGKMAKALEPSGPNICMFYMDSVMQGNILGLIEQYEAMKNGQEYQEGYQAGYRDAKFDAMKAVGGIQHAGRDNEKKRADGVPGI